EEARLRVSPRLLLALFAFAQTHAPNADSMRALQVLAARLHGQILITPQGKLSGTLQANIDDLDRFLAELANFQGTGRLLPVPVQGSTSVTAILGGTLKAPAAEISMTAPSITVGEVQNINLAVQAHYDSSRLLIRQATISLSNQEQLKLAGSVGLR